MARFQAQTNAVLDRELAELQEGLGLASSQKADLLREMSSLAHWVLRQALAGADIVAEGPQGREILAHPVIDALRARPAPVLLTDAEAESLGQILAEPPPPAWTATVRRALEPDRRPPTVAWKD